MICWIMTCSKSEMCFNLCQCRKIIVFSAHLSGIINNNNSFVALVAAPQILKLEIMFSIVIFMHRAPRVSKGS